MDDCTRLLDAGSSVDIIYVDLEKAFDTVSHRKLLFKLVRYGIGGMVLQWLTSFLCGRQQSVRVDDGVSPMVSVASGIPQGTILGPLLFLLFINDLPANIDGCSLSLYADDSKLYGRSDHLSDYLNIYDNLIAAQEWFEAWQLKINLTKCEVLHVSGGLIKLVDKQFFKFRFRLIMSLTFEIRKSGHRDFNVPMTYPLILRRPIEYLD